MKIIRVSPIAIPKTPVPKKSIIRTLSFFGGTYLIVDLLGLRY